MIDSPSTVLQAPECALLRLVASLPLLWVWPVGGACLREGGECVGVEGVECDLVKWEERERVRGTSGEQVSRWGVWRGLVRGLVRRGRDSDGGRPC